MILLLLACLPGEVTHTEHVQPLLDQHCVRCHQDGGIGVGDFEDPDQVQAFAERIVTRAQDGTMPPPASDPECRDYQSSERLTLGDRDLKLLEKWAEQGFAHGEGELQRDLPEENLALSDTDLQLTVPSYAPTFSDDREPGNEYRCFVLEHGRDSDFYITGIQPIIDQSSVLHHMVLGAVPRDELGSAGTGPEGADCINDDMGAIEGLVGVWAPGMEAMEMAEGAGLKVASDEVFVLQMHYFQSSPEALGLVDQSGFALRAAEEVDQPLEMVTVGSQSFRIPAGESDYTFEGAWESESDRRIYGVFPHMHERGVRYTMGLPERKRDSCVLDGPGYDFSNQLYYLFREPLELKAGEQVDYSCTWDNGDNAEDVFYGERTEEEMCFFFVLADAG